MSSPKGIDVTTQALTTAATEVNGGELPDKGQTPDGKDSQVKNKKNVNGSSVFSEKDRD